MNDAAPIDAPDGTDVPPSTRPEPVDDFVPYTSADVDDLLKTILRSPKASIVLAALIIDEQEATPESFTRAQNILKLVFQEELVENNAGALNPEKTRLAQVLFITKQDRISLDHDARPVFRPPSEDGSIQSIASAVSSAILETAKTKAAEPEKIGLSEELYNNIVGIGAVEQVDALKMFSSLTAKVYLELLNTKSGISNTFQSAVQGLTAEDLQAAKNQLQEDLNDIRANITTQEGKKKQAEQTRTNLDVVFKDTMKNVDVTEDLPDIAALMGDDISTANVEAVYQTILEQYALEAQQKKDSKKNQGLKEGLQVQLTRVTTMLQNNQDARNEANMRIAALTAKMQDSSQLKSTAETRKRDAEQQSATALSRSRNAQNLYNRLTGLQVHFNAIMTNDDTVQYNALNQIGSYVSTTALRSACVTLKQKREQLLSATSLVSSRYNTMQRARSTESTSKNTYTSAVRYTQNRLAIYNRTVSYVKSGKSWVYNPQKTANYYRYYWASVTQSVRLQEYNSAVQAKLRAETNYTDAVSAKSTKERQVRTATDAKTTEGSKVQQNMETQKSEANTDKLDADLAKQAADTRARGYGLTISSEQNNITGYSRDIEQETEHVQELNKLIELLQTEKEEIELKIQNAEKSPDGADQPSSTPSPEQESAAALQLRNLVSQREAQTDILADCAKRIKDLRSQETKKQENIHKLEDELSGSGKSREQKVHEAELKKASDIKDAIVLASEQFQAALSAAGYESFGTWSGVRGEVGSVPLLRALVADVKGLSRPAEIRTNAAQESYEQFIGNEVSDVDIQSVESIVSKLQGKLQQNLEDMSTVESASLLQTVEPHLRLEFIEDTDVKPSQSFLINDCHLTDDAALSNAILAPSKTYERRLLYEVKPIFEADEKSSDWIFLRLVSDSSAKPLEDMIQELSAYAQKDWALNCCSEFLIESWLKFKSLKLAGIEDLGNVIATFEDLRTNPEKKLATLDIFLEPTPEGKTGAAFRISKWLVERLLKLREAVLKAQENIVDASQLDVVSVVEKTAEHFTSFTEALTKHAIRLVNLEILKRKTAVLAGDAAQADTVVSGEVTALDDQIAKQQLTIAEAENKIEELKAQYKEALKSAEENENKWESHKSELDAKIDQAEQDLAAKNGALADATRDHASTEADIRQQLDDSARLQQEIDVLKAQRSQVEEKIESAKDAVNAAQQDLNTARGKVGELEIRRNSIQALKSAAEEKRTALVEWMKFVDDVGSQLTTNFNGIIKRKDMAKEYKDLQGDIGGMFRLIGEHLPGLKADAEKFAAVSNVLQRLALRKALDQHLVQFPSLDYQPRSITCPSGLLTVQGISLSYSEVEERLLSFVTERCDRAGLLFGTDGKMYAKDNSSISSFMSDSLPVPVRKLIADRVALCFQPHIEGASLTYEKVLNLKYAQAKSKLDDMKKYCGITKWDVVRAYAGTVEVIVTNSFVIDKPAILPGLNLFVSAGENIHVLVNCNINTSPSSTVQLLHSKARDGKSYRPVESESCGRRGDDGLNAPPGLNAGHINLTAYGLITWEDQYLNITASGAHGLNGQDGGDGDKGINGRKSKAAEPKEVEQGYVNISFGWTRFPGCDKDGKLSPSRQNELSGPGGNGGMPGAGGQGGSGGKIILTDKNNPKIHVTPKNAAAVSAGTGLQHQTVQFGNLVFLVRSQHGADGQHGTGLGKGGDGGDPGQKGAEKCINKVGLCDSPESATGYISKNYEDGLEKDWKYRSVKVAREEVTGDWGWGFRSPACCYSTDDFAWRRYPWVSKNEEQSASYSELSRGPSGNPGSAGGGGDGDGNAHSRQRKRETNKNISAEDEYQRQQYQTIQTMKAEEEFTLLEKEYTAEEQALSQQINALTSQLNTTNKQRNAALENVSRLTEKERKLSEKSNQLQQELTTINNVISKTSSQIVASDKEALSKIIASLKQTEVIAQLSQEIDDIQIDREYDMKASAKLQSIAAGVQALHLAKQLDIKNEQQKLAKQIAALNDSILKAQQLKSELTNVHAISALDALLMRTQSLQQEKTTQQQKQQKSVQIEADLEDDAVAHLIGTTILLSVRDTFARGDALGSIWPELGEHQASDAVEAVLRSIPDVQEGKRAMTVELLEVLTRYCIFTKRLDSLENMLQFGDGNAVDQVVINAVKEIEDEMKLNHWFIGSMTGATLMITSTENITVDDASLTSRYEQVENVAVFGSLTQLERQAAGVVNELKTTGPNLQHIAQFLHDYANEMIAALFMSRQGYLSVLQGNPVKLVDKLSRIILNFFIRHDDALVSQNLELAFGIADTMETIKGSTGIYVLEAALKRIRDIRGGGGFTYLFLKNAEVGRGKHANGDTTGAIAAMRNTIPPPGDDVEGETAVVSLEKVTKYGPRTYQELLSKIDSVVVSTTPVEVMSRMTVVVRALAAGISARTWDELFTVLNRIIAINFSSSAMLAALSFPMSACATVAIKLFSILLADGDKRLQATYEEAAMTRLDVAYLAAQERVARVLSFFQFIRPGPGIVPHWVVFTIPGQDAKMVSTQPMLFVLEQVKMSYPEKSDSNIAFLRSLQENDPYEYAVERVAFNIAVSASDAFRGGGWQRIGTSDNHQDIVLSTDPDQASIVSFLLPLALQAKRISVLSGLQSKFDVTPPINIGDIRQEISQSFISVFSRDLANEAIDDVLSDTVLSLPMGTLESLWRALPSSGGSEEDVTLMILAMLRSDEDLGTGGLREQLEAATFMYQHWPQFATSFEKARYILHEGTAAVVNAVTGNLIAFLDINPTTTTPYIRQALEGVLSELSDLTTTDSEDMLNGFVNAKLELLSVLSDVMTQNDEAKTTRSHSTNEMDRPSAYVTEDIKTLRRILMASTAFAVSGLDPVRVADEVNRALTSPEGDEGSLRAQLAGALKTGQNMEPSQLGIARDIYLTIITRSEYRQATVLYTNELHEVADALLARWKANNDSSSRTVALALLQSLVLEIRSSERKTILEDYSKYSGAQQTLVDSFKSTLVTSTASTDSDDGISPALVSENERRVALWQAIFSQMNDEGLRSGTWNFESMRGDLADSVDADAFELNLAKQINKLIRDRQSATDASTNFPEMLAENTRNPWATANWNDLQGAINAANYATVSDFNYNTQLDMVIDRLATVLPLIKSKIEDELVADIVLRGDAIAWIFERLANAYHGMYMEEFDDDLALRLSTTIEDISRRAEYENASAKLKKAAGQLSSVLERSNPRMGRYSQVDGIVYATYDASDVKRRLAQIDSNSALASEAITRAALIGDFLSDRSHDELKAFAQTVQSSRSFGDSPAQFSSSLDSMISYSGQTVGNNTEARKRLLMIQDDDISTWPTFSSLSATCEFISDEDENEQDLAKEAYATTLKRLAGRLHHVLGMAQESDYNPKRETTDQKLFTKQEYNAAAAIGSDAAYNNLLCNSFFQARFENMSFDVARAQVVPSFTDLAVTDPKAAENLNSLKSNNVPTSRYEILPPPDEGTDIENGIVFEKFDRSVREMVKLLEKAIEAASSCGKPVATLRYLLGDRLDTLATALDQNDIRLEEITLNIDEFAVETVRRIRTAPVFEDLGGFVATLSGLFAGQDLEQIPNYEGLLLAIEDVTDIRAALFSHEGDTILHRAVVSDPNVRKLARAFIPKVIDARIDELQADSRMTAHRVSLLKRFSERIIDELDSIAKGGENFGQQLQDARKMLDAILFHVSDPLGASGLHANALFTADEKIMAELCGPDSTTTATHEIVDGQTVMTATFRWSDELYKHVLLSLLQRATNREIDECFSTLRETFWSPSLPRSGQKPLQLAEDEVRKIEDAKNAIFNVNKVDNLEFAQQQYQNAFNASHYILYLTTGEYIAKVRSPPKPENFDEESREGKIWLQVVNDILKEGRNMVKEIKSAAEDLLDAIGNARKVQERLIAIDPVFPENGANVLSLLDKLLNLPGSTGMAMERALWLLQADDPDLAKSALDAVLEKRQGSTTLDGVVMTAALDLIEANVKELCKAISRDKSRTQTSLTSVAVLRQQKNLESDEWMQFVQLLLTMSGKMVSESREDKATQVASEEEIDALIQSMRLGTESQVWNSSSQMQRLQVQRTPSGWVPILDALSIALSLNFNPETTTEADTKRFNQAAASVMRLRSRRGPLIFSEFMKCLQLLVQSKADANTLAIIAVAVASNRWPFSFASKASYEHAAGLASSSEMLAYLSDQAKIQRETGGERTMARLADIMKEEVEGVNYSVASFLSTMDGETLSNLEKRIENIYRMRDTHTNSAGQVIDDWDKKEIVEWSQAFKNVSEGYFTEDHTEQLDLMLAVFTRVTGKVKGYDNKRPRNPQLLSAILFVDSMVKEKVKLGEIGTGEGKTLIVWMCATARVFKGESVDVITSSPVLAQRDAEEAKNWFKYFDIAVSNNCDDEAEADEGVREARYRDNKVMYGTVGAFERDILLTKYYGKNIRTSVASSLIVDEVDTLFIDSVANTLYISHDIQDLKHLNHIFAAIWMAVHGPDAQYYSESSVELVKRFIDKKMETGVIHVPSWIHDFVSNRLDTWIRNAYNAKDMEEGDQYTLYETGKKRGQVVVVDLYTGVEMPSTQWSNGLHQFVQLKHNNKLSAESLKAVFMANINFVKSYGFRVIGMTGTLGSQPELDLLRRVYNAEPFRMPRFMEERYYEEEAVVLGSRSRWLEQVVDEAMSQSINSEGFDTELTQLDIAHQQNKLNKDLRKIEKLTGKKTACESDIDEVEGLELELLVVNAALSNPDDITTEVIFVLEGVIAELKTADFMVKGSAEYGLDRLNTLSESVTEMKTHLNAVTDAQNESERLTVALSDIRYQLRQQSVRDEVIELSQAMANVNTASNDLATAEELLADLEEQTDAKGKKMLLALSSVHQGVTLLAEEYVRELKEDLKDIEADLAEEHEEAETRRIKLKSSETALATGSGGRPVLVISRNKNDCEDIRDALISRDSEDKEHMTLFVYTGTTEGITEVNLTTGKAIQTHVKLERLKPHDVIVATNIAGRGTSLKTTTVAEQCGGLHVVLSYVPTNIRVELQAWGRTSRHGHNGSGRFVVYDPRVSLSAEDIDIDYLLSERDVEERERLETIETETIPRVNMESILFQKFSEISKDIKALFKIGVSAELQQKELRDKWAFFLESHGEAFEESFMHPKQSKEQLTEALEEFKAQQMEAAEGTFGIITSPGNLQHVVDAALRSKNYSQAESASQAIIDTDKQFAAYGYYYHALSRFSTGTSNFYTKKTAVAELDKAIYLLQRLSDDLQASSQCISSVNGLMQSKGIGLGSKAFEKCNSNTQSLIQTHIIAAEKITGTTLKETDFNTSAISGEATQDIFDLVSTTHSNLRSVLKPLRFTENLEIRLRVAAVEPAEKQQVKFLSDARRGDGNRRKWEEHTLEVGDVTDAELDTVKKSELSWELALYRHGNEFETNERVRVTFPEAVSYAVPEILENLRQIAKDGRGNPISFSKVSEDERAKVKELCYSALLSKEEVEIHLGTLGENEGPRKHLVWANDYKAKALGKWESLGFCGVGAGMKLWVQEQASGGLPIPRDYAISKARELLTANGSGDVAKDAEIVVDAVVTQGVATISMLQRVKKKKLNIVRNDGRIIAVKANVTDAAIDNLDFKGFKVLEKNASKIRTKLKESRGKDLSQDDIQLLLGDDGVGSIEDHSFTILQTLMRALGLADHLCDRLGLSGVSTHKKEPLGDILEKLSETMNVAELAKVTSSAQVQGRLVLQRVLDLPKVIVGISYQEDFVTNLKKIVKAALKARVKTVATLRKSADEYVDTKTTEMLNDVCEAMEGTITDLATVGETVKIKFQTLSKLMKDDKVPPELLDFIAAALEITVKIIKKKTAADYWSWGAFVVALLGVLQVVAGAAVLILSGGSLSNVGGALIGEGIGDMLYAATAGITGTFSWKEYGIQKGISLAVTLGVGLLSAGIGTLVSKTSQVTAMAVKVTVSAVVKAVVKKVAKEVIVSVANHLIGIGLDHLSELAMKELFSTFKGRFQGMAESNSLCVKSVAQIKSTLGKMMDMFGKDQAEKYLKDALKDSAVAADVSKLETRLTGAMMKLATTVSSTLDTVGKRLQQSGSKWAKTVGRMGTIIGHVVTGAEVIHSLSKIVRFLPELYDKLNKRLLGINAPSADYIPKDVLSGSEKDKWIEDQMKEASDKIYDAVEKIAASELTKKAFNKVVEQGMKRVYARTVDKLESDFKALQEREDMAYAVKKLGKKSKLTDKERDAMVTLQEKLSDAKNKYPSALDSVDPVKDARMRVMYMGKETTVGDVTGMLGGRGIQVLRTKSGPPILLRPKYENYIEGISIHKPANLFDLNAMAKAAKVNVTLTVTEDGLDRTVNVRPHDDGVDVPTVNMKLLKNDEYPDGRYVLVDNNGNTKFDKEFNTVGTASAAQQLIYAKAFASENDHQAAMLKANSKDDVSSFLEEVRSSALGDKQTKAMYIQAEYEAESKILGGSSGKTLALVPTPRLKVVSLVVSKSRPKVISAVQTPVRNTLRKSVSAKTDGKTEELKDDTILKRAVKVTELKKDVALPVNGLIQSGARRGAIRVTTSNDKLRSLLNVKAGKKITAKKVLRPRITHTSMVRMKDMLKSMGMENLEKPIKFTVESKDSKILAELKGGVLRYKYSVDGVEGTGVLQWAKKTEAELRALPPWKP